MDNTNTAADVETVEPTGYCSRCGGAYFDDLEAEWHEADAKCIGGDARFECEEVR